MAYGPANSIWVILRYFASSMKITLALLVNRDTKKEKSSKLSCCVSQCIP